MFNRIEVNVNFVVNFQFYCVAGTEKSPVDAKESQRISKNLKKFQRIRKHSEEYPMILRITELNINATRWFHFNYVSGVEKSLGLMSQNLGKSRKISENLRESQKISENPIGD